jgi:hypothetical protein
MEGFVEKIKSITNPHQLSPQSTQQPQQQQQQQQQQPQYKQVIPDEVEKINNIASLYTLLGDVMMDKPKELIIDHIKKLILKAQGM